jgi:hypothetical protein
MNHGFLKQYYDNAANVILRQQYNVEGKNIVQVRDFINLI